MGDGFGNTNEYRLIYLMRQQNVPIVHASPFIDKVQSPRMDFVYIEVKDDEIRSIQYQGKTAEKSIFNEGAIAQYVHVSDRVKEVYEHIINNSTLSTAQKRQDTKLLHEWVEEFGGIGITST